jgi:alpha-tubulin suppressor-like RCC1 family protein
VVGYDLDKAFDAATETYTVYVPNEVSSVEITATTADTAATLKINGTEASSGTAQAVDNLSVGDNPVTVEVTAVEGTMVKTYTLTINRAENSGLPTPAEEYAAGDYARLAGRLAAGRLHAAAVLADGMVEVWGDNSSRQLEITADLTGVKALAAGTASTLALKEDGSIVGWGSNIKGQCDPPVELNGRTVKAVSAYGTTSAALTDDNRVVVWGGYGAGQDPGVKVVQSDKNLVDIAISSNYLLALAADGMVEAWTWRYKEGIGFLYECLPCAVPDGFSGDVVAIATGEHHALALKADGSVVSWGNDEYPVPVGLANVRAVVAGSYYSAVLTAGGGVKVWGRDRYGLLDVPSGLAQVRALAAGNNNMYALLEDGTLMCELNAVIGATSEIGYHNVTCRLY